MKAIGGSINEAIDWTQDHLRTTRPLAERTLFSLLTAEAVTETEDGFMLLETDEDEPRKHHMIVRNRLTKNWFRFHYKRRHAKQITQKRMDQQLQRLKKQDDDSPDVIEDDRHEIF